MANHIGGLTLGFMVGPHQHFSGETQEEGMKTEDEKKQEKGRWRPKLAYIRQSSKRKGEKWPIREEGKRSDGY